MTVDSLKNGIVIDHIQAGKGMELYRFLQLDALDCTVAIIKNVQSKLMGRKDIIKIDAPLDLEFDALGYIDPGATVNIIRDGAIVRKCHLELPEQVVNVIHCKNPRCITATEQGIRQVFRLTNRERAVYRCVYCESRAK